MEITLQLDSLTDTDEVLERVRDLFSSQGSLDLVVGDDKFELKFCSSAAINIENSQRTTATYALRT